MFGIKVSGNVNMRTRISYLTTKVKSNRNTRSHWIQDRGRTKDFLTPCLICSLSGRSVCRSFSHNRDHLCSLPCLGRKTERICTPLFQRTTLLVESFLSDYFGLSRQIVFFFICMCLFTLTLEEGDY